jgi:glycosyltransferase involved in cell wall biosynthesis
MKLLTFTTLYPNAQQPAHGVFVENRLTHLFSSGQIALKVVAPVAYVPAIPGLNARYSQLRRIPYFEERQGIQIHHPRYFLLPKVSMIAAPLSLYIAGKQCISEILRNGYDFDLIDAHYFYPDGVAAALLGRHFRKPVIITARGTDINLIPQHRLPRAMIRWAAGQADGSITVCQALKDAMVELGAAPDKITVLRNGVDLAAFRPVERDRARADLGFRGTTLLSVGHLIPRKGHDLVIRALALLPDHRLAIVGEGPEDTNLRALAQETGVAERVQFLGRLPHQSLPKVYGAADMLVLASSREGWANVLLEAMACGTPVVASNVWGTPEVVATPAVGELLDDLTPDAIARAVNRLQARRPNRQAVRAYAEGFSWDATTAGQISLFRSILQSFQPRRLMRAVQVEQDRR